METRQVFCILCNNTTNSNTTIICNIRKHMIISQYVYKFLRHLSEKVQDKQRKLCEEIWSEEIILTAGDNQSEIYDYDSDGRDYYNDRY